MQFFDIPEIAYSDFDSVEETHVTAAPPLNSCCVPIDGTGGRCNEGRACGICNPAVCGIPRNLIDGTRGSCDEDFKVCDAVVESQSRCRTSCISECGGHHSVVGAIRRPTPWVEIRSYSWQHFFGQ
jgi:hypothetical protein